MGLIRRSDQLGTLKTVIVLLATTLMGVLLIALGATVWKSSWLGQVSNGLASVLLASVLVAWLADFLLRRDFLSDVELAASAALERQVSSLRQLERMGITDVLKEFPLESVRKEFESARSTIRILQTWVPNFEALEGAIETAAASGTVVKILILSEGSDSVRSRARDQGFQNDTAIADSIRANKHYLGRFIARQAQRAVEIREHDGLPSLQIYSGDGLAFLGFYWHGKSSLTGTTLQVKLESPFGAELVAEFERRWNVAKEIGKV